MRHFALVVGLTALGLVACSKGGIPPEQVEAWAGRPAADLVREWGAPTKEVDDAGQRVLIYEEIEQTKAAEFSREVSQRNVGWRPAAPIDGGVLLVRPVLPLLGRRRRQDHPHADPAALTAASPRARPVAPPRSWRGRDPGIS